MLEPIFEVGFAAHSYGFRPQRGAKDALRRVTTLLRAGYLHVVDADLQSYFDTIPQAALRTRMATQVCDGRVLALLDAFLSRTAEDAEQALTTLRTWTEAAGLRLHPQKTRVIDLHVPGGFDFLGYHFERDHRWPREKSRQQLKDQVRQKTRRTNGHSLASIIADVNRTLRGWFEYFKHSHGSFQKVDAWIRMRLRAILCKRRGHAHYPTGADHHRWPNAFFAAQGLFSLSQAHAALRQSSAR